MYKIGRLNCHLDTVFSKNPDDIWMACFEAFCSAYAEYGIKKKNLNSHVSNDAGFRACAAQRGPWVS